jgi:hypothetical protein
MALSYSTAVKNQVANYLFGVTTYAELGAGYNQTLIDSWGASCLLELEEWSKWFAFAAAAGSAPDAWGPWYVDAIIARCEGSAHPERAAAARQKARESMRMALDTYTRNVVSYDPASTTEAFVFHCQNNRKYVLSHCIRLDKPLYPDMTTVDAAYWEAMAFVFNRAGWTFRRRPATMVITRTAFTGAVYTESNKTITTTGVATGLTAGTRFYVTSGGTGVVYPSEHSIASTSSTTIVTADSITGGTAGTFSDVEGYYYVVTFEGLESGESFDSLASSRLTYLDSGHEGETVEWLASDAFQTVRAMDSDGDGRPNYFRTLEAGSSAVGWLFSPPPDGNYRLRCEVFIAQPAAPASATATTAFSKFSTEFQPSVRRLQLDRVLSNYGRRDEALHRDVIDEIESLFPVYQSAGEQASQVGTRDVYRDRAAQDGGFYMSGGGI